MFGLSRGQRPHQHERDAAATERIEQKYEKAIAAFAIEHDLDGRDMTPEMRGRFGVMWRAHLPLLIAEEGPSRLATSTLPADAWLRCEFIRRQVRYGRVSDGQP